MVVCLERGANDLCMVQLTFLVPAYRSCPEKRGRYPSFLLTIHITDVIFPISLTCI